MNGMAALWVNGRGGVDLKPRPCPKKGIVERYKHGGLRKTDLASILYSDRSSASPLPWRGCTCGDRRQKTIPPQPETIP